MREEWKPVVGYEGLYVVSNLGRVKSVERTMQSNRTNVNGEIQVYTYHVKEKILKQGRRHDGYADVSLSNHGVTTLHCVHRLIAEAWIPNPNNYNYVNHIDLDKTNNSIDNLEWISNSGNITHAVQRYANPQSIAVYCKETDQVYASMGQCDRALGLNPGDTWTTINKGTDHGYKLSIATKDQIERAKGSLDADCSWTFKYNKKGRLHAIKRIKCINTQKVYDTLTAASKDTGFCQDSIRASIRNRSCCYGLTFYYIDQHDVDETEYLYETQSNYRVRNYHR